MKSPIELAVFRWLPAFTHGYVKDLRVRWALEEAGLPYELVLVDGMSKDGAAYRDWQPFGQVPAYRDEKITLFESGAIVLHLASQSPTLSPPGSAALARTSAWIFAALNTVEPAVKAFQTAGVSLDGDAARASGLASARAMLIRRLDELSTWLGAKPYLEGTFTAGDLIMTTVLRELDDAGLLELFPAIEALKLRCEARPAFVRALQAQLQTFRDNAPPADA